MVGVDAARPGSQLVEAARRKIVGKRLGGDQRALAGIVEIAQPAIGPAFRHRQPGAEIFGKARVVAGGERPADIAAIAPRHDTERPLGDNVDVIGLASLDQARDVTGRRQRQPDVG